MSELYQKMYAAVGEVDDTLQIICQAVADREYTAEKLRNALLKAEDMYLDAEEN